MNLVPLSFFALPCFTTPLAAALIFNDNGLPIANSGTWSAPTTSINLTAVGDVGGPVVAFSNGQSFDVQLSFSTPLQFRFSTDRSSTVTGSGTASGLVFRLPTGSSLSSGNSLNITSSFPTGFGSASTVQNVFTRGVGASNLAMPDLGNNSRLSYEVRFDPQNNLDGGANSQPGADDAPSDASFTIAAVYWDGTATDFTPTVSGNNIAYDYNNSANGRVPNFRDASGFSGLNGQVNSPTINLDGSATFTNPSSSLGFGVALIDNNDNGQPDTNTDNAAFQSITTTITAGASGISELTRFRLSLDGGPVLSVPEPSLPLFMSTLALAFSLRRVRKS